MSTTGVIMTNLCLTSSLNNNEVTYNEQLSKNAQNIAKKELREDQFTRDQALRQFKQFAQKHPELFDIRIDDNFLIRFLRVKKFNVPMAEHMLVKYINFRQSLPHLCFNLDFKENKVAQLIHDGYVFASPIRDSFGRRVIIAIAARLNPEKYTSVEMAKAHLLAYETLIENEENQVLGVTHFGDTKGVTMSHVSMWSPLELATCLRIGEQAVPMRHKAVHLINVPQAFRYVYDFARSRISEKMRNRFMVHNSIKDVHSQIGSQCLPKEYGGTIPMVEMIESWKKELCGSRERLMALDNMKSLVPIRRKDTAFKEMEGSFKKLEVD